MIRRYLTSFAGLATTLCLTVGVAAEDWPQWMGPNRDGHWPAKQIIDSFPREGLKLQWRVPVAGGYSGPAVALGKVFVTDFLPEAGDLSNDPNRRSAAKGKERVHCFNAADGRLLWSHAYDCVYNVSYPAGPRATPTVADGKVYTLGSEGHLHCLDTETGQVVWMKDLRAEYKTETPLWGFCGAPLVDGPRLICLVGGRGSVAVAFEKDTGKELWRALTASEPGYAPPTIITAGGKRQLLIWHAEAINSLVPETGEVYWSEPLRPNAGMAIAAPRHAGDFLFASGIGNAAAMFKLDREKPAVEIVWRGLPTTAVYSANCTPIIDQGIIYGADCQVGCLRAVELADGKRLWETFQPTTGGDRRMSHGNAFLVKNEDRYFLFSETGDLIIARLTPERYEEISRARLLEPTGEAFGRRVAWSHPAFANRSVYARNDKELVCVFLGKE